MSEPTHLLSPFEIRGLALSNRIVVSPMCQYSSADGFASDWHLVHLGSRAAGGAGLVFTEATAVSPEGRITPSDLGIWNDDHIPALARISDFVHSQGSRIGIQLAHAGRKSSMRVPWEPEALVRPEDGGWLNVMAPSPIPFGENYATPAELDLSGIQKVIDDFIRAAHRAVHAGFDVIELHAAHGYLLHTFLSPLSNRRTDRYGGTLANRSHILTEIVEALRTIWTGPLFVRISATDWAEGGWDIEQAVELAAVLKEAGVDLIDVSSGGMIPKPEIPLGPGYQVPFAARIRRQIPTAAVGMITSPIQADQIVRNGEADLVLLAREMLRDPYWPVHAAATLGRPATWPVQYLRAAPHGSSARFSSLKPKT